MAGMTRRARFAGSRTVKCVVVAAVMLASLGVPVVVPGLLSSANAVAAGYWTSGGPPGGSATAIAVAIRPRQ